MSPSPISILLDSNERGSDRAKALADDPERLSTEFILKLVQGDDA